ncbi:MAG: DNA primase [Tenacibaculum sp.]|nr:DNA primase [Tenacibaculum sp.]
MVEPKFNSLAKEELKNLTTSKARKAKEILNELKNSFQKIDFEKKANTKKIENFKIQQKHYRIIVIDELNKEVRAKNWGLCKQNSDIYLYNGAYWEIINEELFKHFLGEIAKKMGVPYFTEKDFNFKEQLYKQFISDTFLETESVSPNKVSINLLNGTFDIDNKTELRPFNQKDFFTYQLPFNYEPDAKAPIFQEYLNTVLPDKSLQNILSEYLGSLFIKNGNDKLKLEKVLILYGSGANGKSVFFDVVNALLGKENTSNYSLQDLTNENGYYRAEIGNKLLNYASEINGKLESAIFKQLASGEPITARSPYGKPYILKQYAKLIFNSNILPREVEQTNAFFRRFLIVPFKVTIPEEKQDKNLHTKIIGNELSGVFNWVLEGLNRLLKNKNFTYSEGADKAVEDYKKQSDSVKMFLDENNYKPNIEVFIKIKDLYIEYRNYCLEDGFKPVNKSNFKRRLENNKIEVKRINKGNVAYLSNIENDVNF